MRATIRQHPFLSYGLFCILLLLIIRLLQLVGSGHQDGGAGSIAFGLSMFWVLLALPFHLLSQALYVLTGGERLPGHWYIVMAAGYVLFAVADLAWQRHRHRRRRDAAYRMP
jgi:hypothetical protein